MAGSFLPSSVAVRVTLWVVTPLFDLGVANQQGYSPAGEARSSNRPQAGQNREARATLAENHRRERQNDSLR